MLKGQHLTSCQFSCLCYPLYLKHASFIWRIVIPMEIPSGQSPKWLSIPIIATISRLLCQELTVQNEYLRLENKILKSKIKGRIQFTDDEREDHLLMPHSQWAPSSSNRLSTLSNQTPLLPGSDVWIRRSRITQIIPETNLLNKRNRAALPPSFTFPAKLFFRIHSEFITCCVNSLKCFLC